MTHAIDDLYYVKCRIVLPQTVETAKQVLNLLHEYSQPHFSASDEGEILFTFYKNNRLALWFIEDRLLWIYTEGSKNKKGEDLKWEGMLPPKLIADLDNLIGRK